MIYNLVAFSNTNLDSVISIGFFHGYSFITICLIFAQALMYLISASFYTLNTPPNIFLFSIQNFIYNINHADCICSEVVIMVLKYVDSIVKVSMHIFIRNKFKFYY
ncbi:hypothetical protein KSP40_PGU005700 [Platanthera guangdongensis]|uniref:Uncharacterized protein n=1 Tax=Platanthera guangdongensis TaxID=2320717 RepID=A0ABR2LG54_9ASPA